MNVAKSEISFSSKMVARMRDSISNCLSFKEVAIHGKYLGLPTIFDKSKRISLAVIRDRIWKKLQGWKEKLLSRAGKEVLIKAVIQAIPTYAMSCFKLVGALCKDISSIIRRFWWGIPKNHWGICWRSWETLCRPKENGGLGFRDFEIFNQAILAKQFWRIHSRPDSLIARIFKARYFPHGNIWRAKVDSYPSFGWRSIWGAQKMLRDGVRWRVGDGKHIRVWGDAWLEGPGSGRIISPRRSLPAETMVDTFIDAEKKEWREDLVRATFLPFETSKILSILIERLDSRDELCWALSNDGVLRVKDVYHYALSNKPFASASIGPDPTWARLWHLRVPPKVHEFLWRASWDIITHGVNLCRKGISDFLSCVRCGETENLSHVLYECPWAKEFWIEAHLCPPHIFLGSFRDV